MTPKAPPQTLESAQAERQALAAAARAQDEIIDRLSADRLALLTDRRQAWARSVMADQAAIAATLATAERTAARAFQVAAVDGDARASYLIWIDTRNEANLHRDRVVQARAALGEAQDEMGYVHRDVPTFSAEVDRALASEASSRFADRQAQLQLEINALDEIA